MNSMGLRQSPCGVPELLRKHFLFVAPWILGWIVVLLSRKWIILSSSSWIIPFRMSISKFLLMVSNAADMSMPVMVMAVFSLYIFAASHLWVHTTSEVLRSGRNPLWLFDKYSSTSGLIRFNTIVESVFRIVFKSVIGLRFCGGPLAFPAFCIVIRTPPLILSLPHWLKMMCGI